MTFKQWIKQQVKRKDSIGDLARDAQRQPAFRGSTANALKIQMESLGCCDRAIKAWEKAVIEYEIQEISN